jgi:hypothetical protein
MAGTWCCKDSAPFPVFFYVNALMNESGKLPKKTSKPGLILIITTCVAFLGAVFPQGLLAQETITKATETVTVSGATPMGEIIVELPSGAELSGVRSGDALTIHKGPFIGNIPIQRTTLWQTNTSPLPVPSPPTPSYPFSKSDNSKTEAQQWDISSRGLFLDFWNHNNLRIPFAIACLLIVITLVLIIMFSIRSIRRRRDQQEQQSKLRDELQLVRHDLLELHRLLDGYKKLMPDKEPPQSSGEIAECPHCNSGFPVTSLQKGANTCLQCGEAFLYE